MKVWVCSASYQLKYWGWGGGVITSLYAPEVHQCPTGAELEQYHPHGGQEGGQGP